MGVFGLKLPNSVELKVLQVLQVLLVMHIWQILQVGCDGFRSIGAYELLVAEPLVTVPVAQRSAGIGAFVLFAGVCVLILPRFGLG